MPRGKKKKSTSTMTMKVGKKTYKKSSCSKLKRNAQKSAKAIRAKGGTARIKKNGSAWCVYKGPKSKVKRKRA